MKILIVDDSQNWLEYHRHALRELLGDEPKIDIKRVSSVESELSTGEREQYKSVRFDLANSARMGFERVTAELFEPYDIILVDMQMETEFIPLYAGEWLIKQIQFYKEYKDTKIFIISATSNIREIAKKFNVDYIPKYACKDISAYEKIKDSMSS